VGASMVVWTRSGRVAASASSTDRVAWRKSPRSSPVLASAAARCEIACCSVATTVLAVLIPALVRSTAPRANVSSARASVIAVLSRVPIRRPVSLCRQSPGRPAPVRMPWSGPSAGRGRPPRSSSNQGQVEHRPWQ
jgi:hypothetical protein